MSLHTTGLEVVLDVTRRASLDVSRADLSNSDIKVLARSQ